MRKPFKCLLLFIFLAGCRSPGSRSDRASLPSGREGLKALCAESLSGACAVLGQNSPALHPVPILQTVTSTTGSRITVIVPRADRPLYYLRLVNGTDLAQQLTPTRTELHRAALMVDQLEATELKTGERYELIVLGPDGSLWDRREFAAVDLDQARPRLAVVPDADNPALWAQVLRQTPTAIILVKSEATPLVGTPGARERAPNSKVGLYAANPLVPTLASATGLDQNAREDFLALHGQQTSAPSFLTGPETTAAWQAFRLSLFLGADEAWSQARAQELKVPALLVRPPNSASGEGSLNFGGPSLVVSIPEGRLKFAYNILEVMRVERGQMRVSLQTFGPDEKLLNQKTLNVRH